MKKRRNKKVQVRSRQDRVTGNERMFVDKHRSVYGVASTIMGVIALLGFLGLVISSFCAKGNGGVWIGIVGLLFLLIVFIGFVIAFLAFRDKEIFYGLPIVGLSLNGVLIILYMTLYVIGAVS